MNRYIYPKRDLSSKEIGRLRKAWADLWKGRAKGEIKILPEGPRTKQGR